MAEMIQPKELTIKTEKITPARKAIAKNLKQVVDNIAYCALSRKVDSDNLWAYRKQVLADVQEKHGVKLTFLSWIMKATAIALTEYPAFIASWNQETGEVIYPETINMNIAVDTPYGLMVPVVKDVQKLTISEIQKEIIRLAQAAQDKKLKIADIMGGNFTVTNFGSIGAEFGSPIPNLGQVGILGVGAITDGIKVNKDGSMSPYKQMYLTIAADHRWVDGADIGRLNNRIAELLQTPELLGEL